MTSSTSYLKDLLDVLDLILKDLEKRRKEKEELLRMMRTAEWLSHCETEVCQNPLCGGARCKTLSRSPPRCPSPKKPRVVVVDLAASEEQEVVLQMQEGEEMLTSGPGTVPLEDEESADGTSEAASTVILSVKSDHTCEV